MSQKRKLTGQRQSQGAPARASTSMAEDDEDDITFTQPSTSQVQRGLEKLTPGQVDQKAAEVVQFFLVKDQKKLPIRRADIVKHVLKEYRNIYPEIMKRVGRIFDKVFGLKVVEIDNKQHVYILINNMEPVEGAPLTNCPSNSKTGVLMVILGLIYMKGGIVKEGLLWSTLKKLRVDPAEKHENLGDVKKLITDEFVRQRYLEQVRIPHTEPVEYEFRWGQRANFEVSKVKLMEFMGGLFDQDPRSWTQQYREATTGSRTASATHPEATALPC